MNLSQGAPLKKNVELVRRRRSSAAQSVLLNQEIIKKGLASAAARSGCSKALKDSQSYYVLAIVLLWLALGWYLSKCE